MTKHAHLNALAAVICLVGVACMLGGCESSGSQPPLVERHMAAPEPRELQQLRYPGKTTDPEIALGNLDGKIDSLLRVMQLEPDHLVYGQELVVAQLARTQYRGTYDDFPRVDALTGSLLRAHPGDAAAHALRASYLSSVHLFAEAEAELDLALAEGGDAGEEARSTYDLARGIGLVHALELRQRANQAHTTYQTLTNLAAAEAALGRYDDADRHYREALDVYGDVSPLPVAWVFFQRGVLWGEMANRPELARPLYEEAVRRLPDYVVANVHLAEREHADGDTELAIARLGRVVDGTADPEPASRLALYLEASDPARAAQYRRAARSGYELLLAQHGQAFLDHGSEFFAGAGGDSKRALQLALLNLEHRKNGRAFVIALQAADAAHDTRTLCRVLEEAISEPRHHANLDAAIAALQARCE